METRTQTKIAEFDKTGMHGTTIQGEKITEYYLTVKQVSNESILSLFERPANYLAEQKAKIVKMDVLGAIAFFRECRDALINTFPSINRPVNYIDGKSCFNHKIAGMQIYAVSGVAVKTIRLNSIPVGSVFDNDYAKCCFLGNLHSANTTETREVQTEQTLGKMETALQSAGMEMTDLVRTWFFNENIPEWYKEFNSIRSKIYKEKHIFDRFLPASTGIGGDNPNHSALIAGAIAIKPHSQNVKIKEVTSPLQCSAYYYKSSFSRAVEVLMPDHRHLIISGTASIDSAGNTVHVNNVEAQIDLTFRVVEAILKSRCMNYSNVMRAIAYFKRRQDAPALTKYCKKYGLTQSIVLVGNNDVCRDELLFEIEVDAVALNFCNYSGNVSKHPPYPPQGLYSVCPNLSFPHTFSGNPLLPSSRFRLKNCRNDNIVGIFGQTL